MKAELFNADKQMGGQTDRHDEAISRFSKFCERALKKTPAINTKSIVFP